jgi:hypothetical protein
MGVYSTKQFASSALSASLKGGRQEGSSLGADEALYSSIRAI